MNFHCALPAADHWDRLSAASSGWFNGWFGYLLPPEQFRYGAYETWRMRTSPLETNAIPKMTDCLLGLLESLR